MKSFKLRFIKGSLLSINLHTLRSTSRIRTCVNAQMNELRINPFISTFILHEQDPAYLEIHKRQGEMTSPGHRPASPLQSTLACQTPCSPTSGNHRSALSVALATPNHHTALMMVEISIRTATCEGTPPPTHLSSVTQRSQNSK